MHQSLAPALASVQAACLPKSSPPDLQHLLALLRLLRVLQRLATLPTLSRMRRHITRCVAPAAASTATTPSQMIVPAPLLQTYFLVLAPTVSRAPSLTSISTLTYLPLPFTRASSLRLPLSMTVPSGSFMGSHLMAPFTLTKVHISLSWSMLVYFPSV